LLHNVLTCGAAVIAVGVPDLSVMIFIFYCSADQRWNSCMECLFITWSHQWQSCTQYSLVTVQYCIAPCNSIHDVLLDATTLTPLKWQSPGGGQRSEMNW